MDDEVVRIAKKMDKMVQKKNAAGALDLLKELKNIPMTLELLQSTRIGMSVNAIRKQSTDEEVTSLAKSLIKSWKKLLDGPSTDKDSEEKKKILQLHHRIALRHEKKAAPAAMAAAGRMSPMHETPTFPPSLGPPALPTLCG